MHVLRLMPSIVLLLASSAPCVHATEVYRCKGSDGSTVFAARPCGADATKVDSAGTARERNPWDGHPQVDPVIGMSSEDAIAGLGRWCGFTREGPTINRSQSATSLREQWICRDDRYLYFNNGVLTSFKD